MKFKDYYELLEIPRAATAEEVKRAYRRLARKFHPDVSDEPDAEARFKEVQEAYEVLKDPEKRAAYDQFGSNWKSGQEFHPPPDWKPGFDFGGGGFTHAGDFSDFFESLFGQRRAGAPGGQRHPRMKGEDAHARIGVSLEEAFTGTTRNLTLRTPGPGAQSQRAAHARTLKVTVPKGVTNRQRIRLAGQGGPGSGGAPSGDLYLEVVHEPHRWYRSEGKDIYLTLPVTPWEAALGRSVTVPTLAGRVDLKLPASSQSGRQLRLKGRGLPGSPPGDQYVTLEIALPEAKSDSARKLYERMEREMAFDPRAALMK